MEVNKPGGAVRDVAYGPKPKVISLELKGASASDSHGDRAVFEVELATPMCADARYQLAPMEYGYEVVCRIDIGRTTRTVNGYIRIPATRKTVNDRSIPDVADRYREQIVPARLVGFKRLPMEFRSDYDKTVEEFTIIDQQLPGPPPPPGVLEWDGSEHLSTFTMVLTRWTGSIEVHYKITPGFDPVQGQRHFLALAADRVEYLKAHPRPQGGVGDRDGDEGRRAVIHGA